jgi:hypothetical protein
MSRGGGVVATGKRIHSSSPVAAGQRVVELVHVGDAEPPMISNHGHRVTCELLILRLSARNVGGKRARPLARH